MILKTLRGHIKAVTVLLALVLPALSLNAAFDAGFYTQNSALSKGHWVKIKVKDNGIHQITDEELRTMGFAEPERVALYGYSGVRFSNHRLTSDVPDDIPPVPCVRHNGKLLFYGEGDVSLRVKRGSLGSATGNLVAVDRNFYAGYSVYYLTDELPRVSPEEIAYEESASVPLTTSWGAVLYEKEVANEGKVGARYLDVDFNKQRKQSFSFEMPGFNGKDAVNMELMLGLQLNTSSTVPVVLPNGAGVRTPTVWSLSSLYYSYQGNASGYAVKNVVPSEDGKYSLAIDFSSLNGQGALDYFTALYPRDNAMTGAQDCFLFPAIGASDRIGFYLDGKGAMVWDCTDRYAPRVMHLSEADDDGVSAVVSPGDCNVSSSGDVAMLVAFDPDAELLPVEYICEVANKNLHGSDTPHMLIVTAEAFREQAERLAQAHREADGIDVQVVLQDDVYDEFSAGNPHLMGLRRLAKMYRERNPEKFRSILIFGGAHYDNRGLQQPDEREFRRVYVPMFECEDPAKAGNHSYSYATDAYVAMLDEDVKAFDVLSGMMAVNVGRIPAIDVADAEAYVNKAVKYMANPPASDFHTRALLMSHHGDKNSHLDDAESLAKVIAAMSPHTTLFKAYASLMPFDGSLAIPLNHRIETLLKKGVSYWGYSGHGGPDTFGIGKFWTLDMVKKTDYDVPPFVMFATCRSVYIDHPGENMGAELLFKENGGAIGVVGALREVYQDQNRVLNENVGGVFFSGNHALMGDVFRLARNMTVQSASSMTNRDRLVINTLCYNFVGDPEIRHTRPSHRVELGRIGETVINGDDVSDAGTKVVAACKSLELEGTVRDADGNVDGAFNGDVYMTVYGGERTMPVINGSGDELKATVKTDEDIIFEKSFKVKDGRFTGSVFLPAPAIQSSLNRVTFFALSSEDATQGIGVQNNIRISDMAEGDPLGDWSVPVISEMYLDDKGFANGDLMRGEVTLYAGVAPNPIGVSGMNALIGKSVALVLDGGRYTYADAAGSFMADEDGGGELVYPIKDLADGRHTLTLRVSNYAGQTASRSVSFMVVNDKVSCRLEVEEYPASQVATISLRHDFTEEPVGRLIVKNAAGAVVFTDDNATFPYRWNLSDARGAEVAEGIYTVEAYLKGGARYGGASPVEVVVNRD